MTNKGPPDEAEMRRRLSYCPLTGKFTWIAEAARGPRKVGQVAGCINSSGYVHISINRQKYVGARLAWFYMTGVWPDFEVDHKNNIRHDDRWANLRLATPSQNVANGLIRSTNTTGWKGVTVGPSKFKKWLATLKVGGKNVLSKGFDCPAAAHLAYFLAATKHYGEFARAR